MKIKLLTEEAVPPTYATAGSAGLDLYLTKNLYLSDRAKLASTGIAVAIPEGHVGLLALRSSLCERGIYLANGVGIIDSDYRGEIKVPLQLHMAASYQMLDAGERIAQLVIIPFQQQTLKVVKRLPATPRGSGGFGSSNKGGSNAPDQL